ncbi:hypothetical protein [Chlamydia serpentis]|nr:hypothetical protein [Chlamydia serpentis]
MDTSSAIHKVGLFIDVILYPLVAVICFVVSLVFLVLKPIFFSLKFLIMQSIAVCRSRQGPSVEETFECLDRDFLLLSLLLVPLIGTIVHGVLYCLIYSDAQDSEKDLIPELFLMIPIYHTYLVAKTWSVKEGEEA